MTLKIPGSLLVDEKGEAPFHNFITSAEMDFAVGGTQEFSHNGELVREREG